MTEEWETGKGLQRGAGAGGTVEIQLVRGAAEKENWSLTEAAVEEREETLRATGEEETEIELLKVVVARKMTRQWEEPAMDCTHM